MGVTIVHSGDYAFVGLRFLEHRSLCFREKNCILLRVEDATLGCTKFLVNDRRSFRLQWSHYDTKPFLLLGNQYEGSMLRFNAVPRL